MNYEDLVEILNKDEIEEGERGYPWIYVSYGKLEKDNSDAKNYVGPFPSYLEAATAAESRLRREKDALANAKHPAHEHMVHSVNQYGPLVVEVRTLFPYVEAP